ncbi:MAG: hypothetical protein OIF48_08365 [Silicimonas sp.]|nr:hypothetical protein [Silicimonas sp.]
MSFLKRILNSGTPGDPAQGETLRDLGLSRDEINTLHFARAETQTQLGAMARRFGLSRVDLEADKGQAIDISVKCAKCKHAGSCADFLTDRGEFDIGDCPNSDTYARLAAKKAQR